MAAGNSSIQCLRLVHLGPWAWTGSGTGLPDNPSAASAVSAITRVICAASALGARGRASCKPLADAIGLPLRLISCSQTLVTLGCGSGGELCEVGGGSSVDLRYGIGVVPQCGGPAAAVAEAGRSVAQVEPCCEQLAGRVMP